MTGGDDALDFGLSDDTPVYVISVAAQLSGLHPQTLRAYDRLGLVSPGRAVGRGRRYSLRDILALREVQRLSQVEGVNLSGIKRILELERSQERSEALLAELHAQITQLRAELESTRAVAARLAGLLRTRNDGAALVPVRQSDSPAVSSHSPITAGTGTAGTGPAAASPANGRPPTALPAAAGGSAASPGSTVSPRAGTRLQEKHDG